MWIKKWVHSSWQPTKGDVPMIELDFKANSTTEWRECTKMMRSMFWGEFETRRKEDTRRMIQDQINEEFQMQIGAKWHEKDSCLRQDDRNGYRLRSFEVMNGFIPSFVIPRARSIKIHYSAFGLWERVQPKDSSVFFVGVNLIVVF